MEIVLIKIDAGENLADVLTKYEDADKKILRHIEASNARVCNDRHALGPKIADLLQ